MQRSERKFRMLCDGVMGRNLRYYPCDPLAGFGGGSSSESKGRKKKLMPDPREIKIDELEQQVDELKQQNKKLKERVRELELERVPQTRGGPKYPFGRVFKGL